MKEFKQIIGKDSAVNEAVDVSTKGVDPRVLPNEIVAELDARIGDEYTAHYFYRNAANWCKNANYDKAAAYIAWEEMNHITPTERLHIFYRNNELAGYAGILHFLELKGVDGHYGERKKVTILGYGSVSRGAIYALQGRGFNNITVYTKRPTYLVADKNPDVWYKNINDETVYQDLQESDIIFNGVLQDVNNPMMFIPDEYSLSKLKRNASIIDISCDKGMGFYFAQPTSFEHPIINLERGIDYYSVDHTPTYLWNAASREISNALVPFLEDLLKPEKHTENPIINRAIDIADGKILNENIIKFQKR